MECGMVTEEGMATGEMLLFSCVGCYMKCFASWRLSFSGCEELVPVTVFFCPCMLLDGPLMDRTVGGGGREREGEREGGGRERERERGRGGGRERRRGRGRDRSLTSGVFQLQEVLI